MSARAEGPRRAGSGCPCASAAPTDASPAQQPPAGNLLLNGCLLILGQIAKIDSVEREVTVRFDPREVVYDFGELDEVALAYAITIHKSQGSEFPAVVIPLATQQYLLLQRNLVYTGVTRSRHFVIAVPPARLQ
jgi:hypothetical protein